MLIDERCYLELIRGGYVIGMVGVRGKERGLRG
jgi:hypothetical protein